MIGDERKYLTCLFTMKTVFDTQLGKPTKLLTPEVLSILSSLNSKSRTSEEAVQDPLVLNFIERCVEQVNSKAVSRVNQIKRWQIVD